jgi:hypothetical protein
MAGAVGSVTLLDVTYTIDDAAGVGQNIAVVQGAAYGTCKKPAAANAAGFLGITKTKQSVQNKGVSVAKLGIVPAIAAGAITRGDRLNIADNTGKVQSCEATVAAALAGAATVINVIGQAENSVANAGDIVYVNLAPCSVALAVS